MKRNSNNGVLIPVEDFASLCDARSRKKGGGVPSEVWDFIAEQLADEEEAHSVSYVVDNFIVNGTHDFLDDVVGNEDYDGYVDVSKSKEEIMEEIEDNYTVIDDYVIFDFGF